MAPPHTEPRRWACQKCHHETQTQNSSNCQRCHHHCCTECRTKWRWGFDNAKMIWFSSDVTDLHFHRHKRAIIRNLDPHGPSRCSEYHSLISHHLLIHIGVSLYLGILRSGVSSNSPASPVHQVRISSEPPKRQSSVVSLSSIHQRCFAVTGADLRHTIALS